MRKYLIAVLLAFALAGCASFERALAPAAELDAHFDRSDETSTRAPDHGPWAALLERHRRMGADRIARFDYAGVRPAERAALGAYIDALAAEDPRRLSRDVQFAYWVNLYNALTVRVVLDRYPVASILDIRLTSGLFVYGPWRAKLVEVAGVALSLDDIEHRILRPIWRDPRIHYVVNCASLGCPDLPAAPLEADGLDAALDAAARAYVAHPRGLAFEEPHAIVSKIYLWFREDFGADAAGVIAHLARHADAPTQARLAAVRGIADYRYDWALNDAR